MMPITWLFFLVVGVALLFYVLRLVRNMKLREKYAALWLLMGVVIVIMMVFPHLLDWIAGFLGIATPVNLLFLIAILLLLGVTLHLSLEISRLEDETRVLAEESAIQRSLLARQLDRISRDRNPTSALPVIRTDEHGTPLRRSADGSSATDPDQHHDPENPSHDR